MIKRKLRISVDENDDFWTIIHKLNAELIKRKPRKRFQKSIKSSVLFEQDYRCKFCFVYLEYPEFDHIDGDRSNNSYKNCQSLCPNCHAKKTRQEIKNKTNWQSS